MTWIVSSLAIRGVKGVLDRAGEFKLGHKNGVPRSIAIFGRNGQGKSGYADAMEYVLAVDGGAVEHLGKGGADSEHGGKHAIPHVLAEERGISPEVVIEFVDMETGERISATRPVQTGRIDPRPKEIDRVSAQAPAFNILRQHDLRRFVVDMSPGEKFGEFARWIGLEHIANMVTHLTTTQNTLKNTEVDREIAVHQESIKEHTSGAITSPDEHKILKWCTVKAGEYLEAQDIPEGIPNVIAALVRRREEIIQQSKGALAAQTKKQLAKATSVLTDSTGTLGKLESSYSQGIEAEKARDQAESDASDSVFQEVWKAAKSLLPTARPEVCPVCQTPWCETRAGSVEGALVTLSDSLDTLTEFQTASAVFSTKRQAFDKATTRLDSELEQIGKLAETLSLTQVVGQTRKLRAGCAQMSSEKGLKDLRAQFTGFHRECEAFAGTQIPEALAGLPDEVTPQEASQIDDSIANLRALDEAVQGLGKLKRREAAIRQVERQFARVAEEMRAQAKALVEGAVAVLGSDVEDIYQQIHPGEAVPHVHIVMDPDEKTLTLRVSFHSDDRIVPPAGYLSESQINTLGLALFLSAVRRFNGAFPFLVLDDIVSSYDADNRARIVDLLAEHMKGFQIFLTTHDERFYKHLKQRLQSDNWRFDRITGYEFERGPRRESEGSPSDEISKLIEGGDPQIAGNAVRQRMEDWFDSMCDKYKVRTLHRRGTHEYERTLSDFWEPFRKRALELRGIFKGVVDNSVAYQRISAAPIINYYSHNQANPYEWSAMGDVRYVWETFLEFTNLFRCYSCEKVLHFNPDKNTLYCTCGRAILPPVQQPAADG